MMNTLSQALAVASVALVASGASAAPVLDQSSTPTGTSTLQNTQFGLLGGPIVGAVQQFTVGRDGTLADIALGMSGSGAATLSLYAGHGDPTYATPIYSQAITLSWFSPDLAPFDWSTLPRWDVSAGNIAVTTGELLSFEITPADPGSAAVWMNYSNVSFSYDGGRSLLSLGYYAADFGMTMAFQTYVEARAAAAPEPASWGMLLIGFGAIGSALRSRRSGAGQGRTA